MTQEVDRMAGNNIKAFNSFTVFMEISRGFLQKY